MEGRWTEEWMTGRRVEGGYVWRLEKVTAAGGRLKGGDAAWGRGWKRRDRGIEGHFMEGWMVGKG